MTDPQTSDDHPDRPDPHVDPRLDPRLDPREEARVRGLLAEVGTGGAGEPVPPAVAARLEEALARLRAEGAPTGLPEEAAEETLAPVVPLRRRWAPRLGAAAAAVVVLGGGGLAVAQWTAQQGGVADTSSSGAGGATADQGPLDRRTELGSSPSSTPSPSASPGGSRSLDLASPSTLPRVRAGSLGRDVTGLLASGRVAAPTTPPQDAAATPVPPTTARVPGCPGPPVSDGASVAVVAYAGRPAALVLHPVVDGRRQVEVWSCAGTTRLASATVSP